MKKLLEILGFRRETKTAEQRKLLQQEPICNLSLKNNYFNSLYLASVRIENEKRGQLTSEEFEALGASIQRRSGIVVTYHPEYFSFA